MQFSFPKKKKNMVVVKPTISKTLNGTHLQGCVSYFTRM